MMIHLASSNTNSSLSAFSDNQIQPNAIDLCIDKLFEISDSEFHLCHDDYKIHRTKNEVHPNSAGMWQLSPGSYEIVMDGIITIGDDEAGFVITRSSLNRNGIFITSGLYDSGYSGVMAGVMHVNCGGFSLAWRARVGQFLLFKAESIGQYQGSYGTNSTHDKIYNKE